MPPVGDARTGTSRIILVDEIHRHGQIHFRAFAHQASDRHPAAGRETSEREAAMSQQMVGIVMNRLPTDEDLRIRFTVEPVETLADLQARGFELTPPSTGPLRIKKPS
jgi:hypothetical protein